MEEAQREALASLRLTWAPTADDLWRPQAETHVKGLNEYAADDVMEAFGDAARDPVSTPLGVVVRGPAGSGKTHLLGQRSGPADDEADRGGVARTFGLPPRQQDGEDGRHDAER